MSKKKRIADPYDASIAALAHFDFDRAERRAMEIDTDYAREVALFQVDIVRRIERCLRASNWEEALALVDDVAAASLAKYLSLLIRTNEKGDALSLPNSVVRQVVLTAEDAEEGTSEDTDEDDEEGDTKEGNSKEDDTDVAVESAKASEQGHRENIRQSKPDPLPYAAPTEEILSRTLAEAKIELKDEDDAKLLDYLFYKRNKAVLYEEIGYLLWNDPHLGPHRKKILHKRITSINKRLDALNYSLGIIQTFAGVGYQLTTNATPELKEIFVAMHEWKRPKRERRSKLLQLLHDRKDTPVPRIDIARNVLDEEECTTSVERLLKEDVNSILKLIKKTGYRLGIVEILRGGDYQLTTSAPIPFPEYADLTPTERVLFRYAMENQRRVVSNEELGKLLWETFGDTEYAVLYQTLESLAKKRRKHSNGGWLQIRDNGHLFNYDTNIPGDVFKHLRFDEYVLLVHFLRHEGVPIGRGTLREVLDAARARLKTSVPANDNKIQSRTMPAIIAKAEGAAFRELPGAPPLKIGGYTLAACEWLKKPEPDALAQDVTPSRGAGPGTVAAPPA